VLVLTRFIDESIVIGGDIIVTVLEVHRNGKVKIGVEANESIPIHRMEVQRAIWRDGLDAGRERREGGGA
jgi:carbon storage regulator